MVKLVQPCDKKDKPKDVYRKRTICRRKNVPGDPKSADKPRMWYSIDKRVQDPYKAAETTETTSLLKDSLGDVEPQSEPKLVELIEKKRKHCFYRSSVTSQMKQHQVKPTEFGKYGDDGK